MSFDIAIAQNVSELFGEAGHEGRIELSGSIERFFSPVSFWTREQYIDNWKHSFAEGYKSKTHSALVVSMRDPRQANFLILWVLYYRGDRVFVQNRILFLEDIIEGFKISNLNDYIDERATVNEEGVRISEWEVSLEDVLVFFSGLS